MFGVKLFKGLDKTALKETVKNHLLNDKVKDLDSIKTEKFSGRTESCTKATSCIFTLHLL